MQPTRRQVPPSLGCFSISAVFRPYWPPRIAAEYPPGPLPMTMRSYVIHSIIVASRTGLPDLSDDKRLKECFTRVQTPRSCRDASQRPCVSKTQIRLIMVRNMAFQMRGKSLERGQRNTYIRLIGGFTDQFRLIQQRNVPGDVKGEPFGRIADLRHILLFIIEVKDQVVANPLKRQPYITVLSTHPQGQPQFVKQLIYTIVLNLGIRKMEVCLG